MPGNNGLFYDGRTTSPSTTFGTTPAYTEATTIGITPNYTENATVGITSVSSPFGAEYLQTIFWVYLCLLVIIFLFICIHRRADFAAFYRRNLQQSRESFPLKLGPEWHYVKMHKSMMSSSKAFTSLILMFKSVVEKDCSILRVLHIYCKSGHLRWWLRTFSIVKQYTWVLNTRMHGIPN